MSKLNLGIGIGVAAVVVALFVIVIVGRCGCNEELQKAVDVEDRGMIQVKLRNGDVVQARLGFEVYQVIGDETVNDAQLAGAIDWWASELGVQRLAGRRDPVGYHKAMDGPEHARAGLMLVSVEELQSQRCGGETTVYWDLDTGHIIYSVVRIAAAHSYHTPTYQAALEHEMGHGLGLDDDPYSVESRSVMRCKLVINGEVTALDRGLLATVH